MLNPWVLLGIAVSVAMLVCAPFLWRRRGAVFGLRWTAVSLLPAGLGMTGLFRLFGRVGKAFFTFFTETAFAPRVWVGYALVAVAVVVWLVARTVSARGGGRRQSGAAPAVAAPGSSAGGTQAVERSRVRTAPASTVGGDDEFADVEAILRRRGI